ncbi:MAG TPA: ribonuclease domain-containing protein [Pseudonocardiaceae bacterium]|nr:ribonuclease domain-containing protein [Pseudonocardiaceae bacterium]
MTPARRLTVALVGLIVLVVVGWFAKDFAGGTTTEPGSGTLSTGATSSATVGGAPSSAGTRAVPGSESGLPVKPLSSLPGETTATWKLIVKGGPFPYPRNDGVMFQNREKRLPGKAGDYYKEYTVPTPGSPDRGARRLITGTKQEVFYTGDHYDSFVVVDVQR